MPHPKSNERKSDFMKRCIPQLIEEGREQKQAIAICYSIWDREKSNGNSNKKVHMMMLLH